MVSQGYIIDKILHAGRSNTCRLKQIGGFNMIQEVNNHGPWTINGLLNINGLLTFINHNRNLNDPDETDPWSKAVAAAQAQQNAGDQHPGVQDRPRDLRRAH